MRRFSHQRGSRRKEKGWRAPTRHEPTLTDAMYTAERSIRAYAVASATPHPPPQRERPEARQCQRGTQQPPRRQGRCRCCGTRACSHPVGQVAAHRRVGAGRVAADAIDAEAGGALRGCGTGTALRDRSVGGGRGGCAGRRLRRRVGDTRRRTRRPATTHDRLVGETAGLLGVYTPPIKSTKNGTHAPTDIRGLHGTIGLAAVALTQAAHVLRAHCVNASRSDDRHCRRDARSECPDTSHPSIPISPGIESTRVGRPRPATLLSPPRVNAQAKGWRAAPGIGGGGQPGQVQRARRGESALCGRRVQAALEQRCLASA
jgi:hypothetical protein